MPDPFAVVENGTLVEARNAHLIVPWWSFTKTIIATAALVLVQEKRLGLDRRLPHKLYTLRQLLQHRAGLANYGTLAAYHEAVARDDDPWPVPELLERAQANRLRYPPGQGWAYSNIGYLFARELIEQVCGEGLDVALAHLVLDPLGVDGARVVRVRADLDGVTMGVGSYHPGWVYHGLLVGPLQAAALLLDRLLNGALLAPELLAQMRDGYRLGWPVPIRSWTAPGYGLGVMCGTVSTGARMVGHTGGGPGSVIAVYHAPEAASEYTTAAFALGDDQAAVEDAAFGFGPRNATDQPSWLG